MSGISAADWANIVTSYQRGEKSPVELAKDYGVDHRDITQGLRSRGVSRSSKLTENVKDEVDEARLARDVQTKKAADSRDRYSRFHDAIAQMVMKRVIDGDRDNTLPNMAVDIRVLGQASKIIERARQENWDILDIKKLLEDGEELPDLNVGEYSPAELEDIRRANEDHYLEANDLNDVDVYPADEGDDGGEEAGD